MVTRWIRVVTMTEEKTMDFKQIEHSVLKFEPMPDNAPLHEQMCYFALRHLYDNRCCIVTAGAGIFYSMPIVRHLRTGLHGTDGFPCGVRLLLLPPQHVVPRHVRSEPYDCLRGLRPSHLSLVQSLGNYEMVGYLCHQSVVRLPARPAAHVDGLAGDDVLHTHQVVLEDIRRVTGD